MCGLVIQSSAPVKYGIVDGLNVRDSRVHNYPPRWNSAPSQELLVIRRNHKTGEVSLDPLRWGLIPYWCEDPKGGRKPINAKCETVHSLPTSRDAYRQRRCILPVDGFFEWKAIKGQKAKQPYAIAIKDRSSRAACRSAMPFAFRPRGGSDRRRPRCAAKGWPATRISAITQLRKMVLTEC
jgi:putative SOS response-associated peptidase YedK